MNGNNISQLITYKSYFYKFKELSDQGVLEINVCNIALVGIAKDLEVANPVLL